MAPEFNERQLLERAQRGDHRALERLLYSHYDSLAKHVRYRLGGAYRHLLSREDILQETFVEAFRSIAAFEPRRVSSFLSWLKAIAEHRIQDALKKLNRKKRAGDHRDARLPQPTSSAAQLADLLPADCRSPSDSAARREAVRAVRAGLAMLPDDQRQAIIARYFHRQSLEETAAAMGRTRGSVRGLVQRAMRALRERLDRPSQWFGKH